MPSTTTWDRSLLLPYFLPQSSPAAIPGEIPPQLALPVGARRGCVVGPRGSGKTSALMQYALNVAACGASVLFVCRREKMQVACPLQMLAKDSSSQGNGHSGAARAALAKIHMKYAESGEEVLTLLANLHLLPRAQAVGLLVIDDFGDYFRDLAKDVMSPGRAFLKLVQALGLLSNVARTVAGPGAGTADDVARSAQAQVLISDTFGGAPDIGEPTRMHLYGHWMDVVFRLCRGRGTDVNLVASLQQGAGMDFCGGDDKTKKDPLRKIVMAVGGASSSSPSSSILAA